MCTTAGPNPPPLILLIVYPIINDPLPKYPKNLPIWQVLAFKFAKQASSIFQHLCNNKYISFYYFVTGRLLDTEYLEKGKYVRV